MSASPTPRPAHTGDAEEIARLSTLLGYPADAQAIRDRLNHLLARDEHFIRVVPGEHGLLGWIAAEQRLLLESGSKPEIVGLVVDAAAKRRGVGKALVASVEAWARQRGQHCVVVRSNVLRAESHPFYEQLGFVREKTQHVYALAL